MIVPVKKKNTGLACRANSARAETIKIRPVRRQVARYFFSVSVAFWRLLFLSLYFKPLPFYRLVTD